MTLKCHNIEDKILMFENVENAFETDYIPNGKYRRCKIFENKSSNWEISYCLVKGHCIETGFKHFYGTVLSVDSYPLRYFVFNILPISHFDFPIFERFSNYHMFSIFRPFDI